MNATTTDTTDADTATGYRALRYALNTLAWGVTVAIAWSCSTLLMGIIMFIVMSMVMGLLLALVQLVILFKVDASVFTAAGCAINRTIGKVAGVFTRYSGATA